MLPIQDSRISYDELLGRWGADCVCGKTVWFAYKEGAVKMLRRGNCRYCKRDYREVPQEGVEIYKNSSGKWCSTCSGCGKEQAYTRKDHAKQSELNDWQCKPCVSKAKGFSKNQPVGDRARLYNKFRKSANNRGIEWGLDIESMYADYDGKCKLTGWEIELGYSKGTASLDRVDSTKGYTPENIQWVHSMVNMAKNKYGNEEFIEMCKAVSNKVKW